MKRENVCGMAVGVLIAFIMLSTQSMAQNDDKSFKVGDKIEYKEGYEPRETWSEGTIDRIDTTYGGVIVRTTAGVTFFIKTTDVRHLKTHPNPGAVNVGENLVVDQQTVPPNNRPLPADTGEGLMTKEEITGIFRSSPRANTDRQFCKDLIEQIKRRGVKEQFSQKDDDLTPLSNSKCWYQSPETNVHEAIDYNLGPPVTLRWLEAGPWKLTTIGATVDTAHGNGDIYRQNEAYGKLGFLTIDGGGTYIWKVYPTDPPAKYIHGAWRNTTTEELGLRGGDGIVLKSGFQGDDWIVFKNLDEPHPGNGIEIRSVQQGVGKRYFGSR